jgi:hypothetical protein
MDTLKNIILGLLIGIVICMGFEISNLKKQVVDTQQKNIVVQNQKGDINPNEMFQQFFDMVLEFERKKQAQEKAQADEQESTK